MRGPQSGRRPRSRVCGHGLHAPFESGDPAGDAQPRRIRDDGRGPPDQSRGSTTAGRKLDPWAEEEPVFGHRETAHALSTHPGTPPCGNLAVEPPSGHLPSPPGVPTAAPRPAKGLVRLRRPVRAEIETGLTPAWVFGLVERASMSGMEINVMDPPPGFSPGRRDEVRVLVTPRAGAGFVVRARFVQYRVSDRGGSARGQLLLTERGDWSLSQWAAVVQGGDGGP